MVLQRCWKKFHGWVHHVGASHSRFFEDEMADMLGFRNISLQHFHGDHKYLEGKVGHDHTLFFNDIVRQFSKYSDIINQGEVPLGLRSGDYLTVQSGTWDMATCVNLDESMPMMDSH